MYFRGMTSENGMIAATILEQLGGRRFQLMTGAKNLMAITRGLSMRLPIGKFSAMHVVLEPNDTYTITCYKGSGLKSRPVQTEECVYADNLPAMFTSLTGLATRL